MKRSRNTTPKQNSTNDCARDFEHDSNAVACLEKLSEELEHPSRSRRAGARAATRHLNQLVNLRAEADGISRRDAWVRVFDMDEPLLERASANDADRATSAPPSVEQIVHDLERSILSREQARNFDDSTRGDLLN